MITEFNIEGTVYVPSKVVRIEIIEEDALEYCLSSKDVDAEERQAEEQEEVCGMWKTEKKTPRAK